MPRTVHARSYPGIGGLAFYSIVYVTTLSRRKARSAATDLCRPGLPDILPRTSEHFVVPCYSRRGCAVSERIAMQNTYDRAAEDIGNIVHLEHVNVTIPDQRLATLFYVAGLGLTRDPYLMVSDTNMWVNVGRSQFHLPSGDAQVLRGVTGIVMAGRLALLSRLSDVHDKLANTSFAFAEHNDYVEA